MHHISYYNIQVIDADSVDLWSKDADVVKLETETLIYPPSFQVDIISQHATGSTFVTLHFNLNSGKPQVFTINIPLVSIQRSEG